MDVSFPVVTPPLCLQLVASRSSAVAASATLDALVMQTSKPHLLAQAYLSVLQQQKGNSRLLSAVLDKLAGSICVAQIHFECYTHLCVVRFFDVAVHCCVAA